MKILVVDDEHILRTRLKSVLEQSGLPLSAVFTAENALNAIECIEKEQPQIVITDIRMPIMSGLELATHIHTHYPQIKVILVTGYSDFEYARTAIQNNVFEYLLKPIDSENLIAVILRAQKEIESAEKNERLFKVFKEHFSAFQKRRVSKRGRPARSLRVQFQNLSSRFRVLPYRHGCRTA